MFVTNPTIYKTIPEQLEAHLKREILSGSLKPSQPLREQEVSERFGISRDLVQEFFNRLAQQGLVIPEANKGIKVASRPHESLRPLLVELRKTIETFVLESIFDNIKKEDIKVWENILKNIKQACKDGNTTALVEHDLSFHSAIIRSRDDKDIFTLWQPIVIRMLIHYERFGDLMESYYEHKNILDAIKAENKQEALKALIDNIQ